MITVFFGAGASKYFGIPTMKEFPEDFEKYLEEKGEYDEKNLYKQIKGNLKEVFGDLDLEAILTVLEDLSEKERFDSRFEHPSILFFLKSYNQISNTRKLIEIEVKRDREVAKRLKEKLKGFIRMKCTPKDFKDKIWLYDVFFDAFIGKISGYGFKSVRERSGKVAVYCEIFTTNYDLCVENYCKIGNIAYINGEIIIDTGKQIVDITKNSGDLFSESAKFHIYKLHGSINWYKIKDRDIRDVIEWDRAPLNRGDMTFDYTEIEGELMIYPIQEKQIYKDPFSDMFIRLKKSLESNDYCFVVGYSFRDEEIRGIFDDAMFERDRKGRKTRIFLIDLSADEIIENRLKSINELKNVEIKPINREFNIYAINNLQGMIG